VVAKSWYDENFIRKTFSLPLPVEYYPAHLPGFPLTIRFLNYFIPGPWAMLSATLIATIACTVLFYLFLLKFRLSENPLWLTLVFLVFPGRWVAVKAVGSPEPLFIFAILASFYFFKSAFDKEENNLFSRKKSVALDLLLAGFFGALAQITKSPGILLFVGYEIYLLKRFSNNFKNVCFNDLNHCIKYSLPLLLIPLSALGVFIFYWIRTGDFLAYFHSGDNFHLVFPPYQGFFPERSWLGTFWNEDMIWQYLTGALTVILLIKQKYDDLACFAIVFFTATLFVAHRDLARYSLPLVPFSLIAFDKVIQKKEFKIALLIILPAIYLYAINFIGGNTAPVADWTPYL
ncbi:MAG: phospholipid carrier-dependent glycosyltransferase, partial [Microgenomates group bacterium]